MPYLSEYASSRKSDNPCHSVLLPLKAGDYGAFLRLHILALFGGLHYLLSNLNTALIGYVLTFEIQIICLNRFLTAVIVFLRLSTLSIGIYGIFSLLLLQLGAPGFFRGMPL